MKKLFTFVSVWMLVVAAVLSCTKQQGQVAGQVVQVAAPIAKDACYELVDAGVIPAVVSIACPLLDNGTPTGQTIVVTLPRASWEAMKARETDGGVK